MATVIVSRPNLTDSKAMVVKAIAKGKTVAEAMESVGRVVKTYEGWRAADPKFRSAVDVARGVLVQTEERQLSRPDALLLGFAEWRKEYLGYETYPHQQQWVDVLEGKDPVPMTGCEWNKRNINRVVVNVPPGHSKSSTITVDYVTYKICMNPDVRIAIISKRRESAGKFLYQIKQRLTSNLYAKLQKAYAPVGGFRPEKGDGQFSAYMFYVAGRKADQKDATVEALGLGSSIYGARYDLVIIDDAIVLDNAPNYEKQMTWLESEVENRVKNGKIIVIGTRLASTDLYSELRNDEHYLNGKSPWSYLRQPMVLEFAENPEDWVTLWPKSTSPFDEADDEDARLPDGTFRMWDGPTAANIRASKPPKVWSLVYMQTQTSEDQTFSPLQINGCINRLRKPGPLSAGGLGHPHSGGEGMYTIASMDPAMSGDTFIVVGKVDRATKRRWIENAFVQTNPTNRWIHDIIESVTEQYGVNEWVIEKNAFQIYLLQDEAINKYLNNRGAKMVPHYTGANKADPDFGVASVASVFGQTRRLVDGGREVFVPGSNLLELPDPDKSTGIRTLIEELLTWEPGKTGKQLRMDGPMALWFFELRARLILGGNSTSGTATHMTIPGLMRGRVGQRATTPMSNRSFFRP